MSPFLKITVTAVCMIGHTSSDTNQEHRGGGDNRFIAKKQVETDAQDDGETGWWGIQRKQGQICWEGGWRAGGAERGFQGDHDGASELIGPGAEDRETTINKCYENTEEETSAKALYHCG